jgi:hypothetical protein
VDCNHLQLVFLTRRFGNGDPFTGCKYAWAAMLEIAFKLTEAQTVALDECEGAQLGLHLAVFGRDDEMLRSRLLAEKIATAIETGLPGRACPVTAFETAARRYSCRARRDDRQPRRALERTRATPSGMR